MSGSPMTAMIAPWIRSSPRVVAMKTNPPPTVTIRYRSAIATAYATYHFHTAGGPSGRGGGILMPGAAGPNGEPPEPPGGAPNPPAGGPAFIHAIVLRRAFAHDRRRQILRQG